MNTQMVTISDSEDDHCAPSNEVEQLVFQDPAETTNLPNEVSCASSPDVELPAKPCDPAVFAARQLKQESVSRAAILALVRLLPRESPHNHKHAELPFPQGALDAGMYHKGAGMAGFRKSRNHSLSKLLSSTEF